MIHDFNGFDLIQKIAARAAGCIWAVISLGGHGIKEMWWAA